MSSMRIMPVAAPMFAVWLTDSEHRGVVLIVACAVLLLVTALLAVRTIRQRIAAAPAPGEDQIT